MLVIELGNYMKRVRILVKLRGSISYPWSLVPSVKKLGEGPDDVSLTFSRSSESGE